MRLLMEINVVMLFPPRGASILHAPSQPPFPNLSLMNLDIAPFPNLSLMNLDIVILEYMHDVSSHTLH